MTEVEGTIAREAIEQVVRVRSERNCLHEAFFGRLHRTAFDGLIEKSTSAALTHGDVDGNTPLHLAVKHRHFHHLVDSGRALRIIEKLVQKCPAALAEENNQKLTPIRLLKESEKEFEAEFGNDPKQTEKKSEIRQDGKGDLSKTPTDGESLKRTRSWASSGVLTAISSSNLTLLGKPESTSKVDANAKVVRAPKRMISRPSNKGRPKAQAKGPEPIKIGETYRKIEEFLKKFILQNFVLSQASTILYGPVAGISNPCRITKGHESPFLSSFI